MINLSEVGERELVNISFSISLQNALVNEIYPEMRAVCGCILHARKEVEIVVIYSGSLSKDCENALEGVRFDASDGLPDDFSVDLKIIEINPPNWLTFDIPDDGYLVIAYQQHVDVDYSTAHITKLVYT